MFPPQLFFQSNDSRFHTTTVGHGRSPFFGTLYRTSLQWWLTIASRELLLRILKWSTSRPAPPARWSRPAKDESRRQEHSEERIALRSSHSLEPWLLIPLSSRALGC